MPVILQPEDEEQWLDASRTPFTKARSLLKPLPAELMAACDVSPIVNSAKYSREILAWGNHAVPKPVQVYGLPRCVTHTQISFPPLSPWG